MTLTLPPTVPKDAPLLVAYSGGADSRLLLTLAKDYGDTHGVPVYAAHLHHGIRGEEADRDLAFCRRTASELGIPLFEKQADIPTLSRASGQSLEVEAREQRYEFFRDVMETHQIPILLTAHHADDQLETLLLRFLRGSGTRGMGGIPEVRPLAYGMTVRPLLGWTKAEILQACRDLALDYVSDSTNEAPFTLRNRLRKEIVPVLEQMTENGIPQSMAGRLARAASEDNDCLAALAQADMSVCAADGGLSVSALRQRHPAIAKRILSMAYGEAVLRSYGAPPDSRHTLTAVHLEALVSLYTKAEGGASLDLPLMVADVRKGVLSFIPTKDATPKTTALPIALYEGETIWDHGRTVIRIERTQAPCEPISGDHVIASAVFPALDLPLWARPREAGDIIRSHGMRKKLKKLLCDKGIPPHLRDRLPLICQGDGLTPLWYPTVAFADGFSPPKEGPALRVSIIRHEFKNSGKDIHI